MTKTNDRPAVQGEKRQRNRVRGLIGAARALKFGCTSAQKAREYRIRLNETLLAARTEISSQNYSRHIAWIGQQTKSIPNSIKRAPVGFDFLSGIIEAKPLPLESELRWVSLRLAEAASEISRFRVLADDLEDAFWNGDKRRVRAIATTIRAFSGQSMWLIETRVGTLQQFEGLEAQKRYVNGIKFRARRSLASYISHYLGVRNEPNITPARFASAMRARIDRSRFRRDTKAYLKFRLSGEFPSTNSGLSAILRVEQSHGTIDLYETFISIIQHIVSKKNSAVVVEQICESLNTLKEIQDWRLDKIAMLLGRPRHITTLPLSNLKAQAALLEALPLPAYKASLQIIKETPSDIGQAITAGRALASSERRLRVRNDPPWRYVVDRLAIIFGISDGSRSPLATS